MTTTQPPPPTHPPIPSTSKISPSTSSSTPPPYTHTNEWSTNPFSYSTENENDPLISGGPASSSSKYHKDISPSSSSHSHSRSPVGKMDRYSTGYDQSQIPAPGPGSSNLSFLVDGDGRSEYGIKDLGNG
ncbi:hypothetical protein I302_105212 [Kwoniella bestiolae CBS 10118]|uniref:Uncharacterized protein n=1 Tax=Kwoniella bestiolae CBS 10118 TaxID=1296100 RepID=A0AAJ8K8M9_9TREE